MNKLLMIIGVTGLLITGCGTSSYITKSWKAPVASARQYNKVLVLGLIGGDDPVLREKIETHIVDDLKTLGYDAICSCQEYEPKAFERMSENDAIAKLSGGGIDAVLTVVLLDKKKEKYYIPQGKGAGMQTGRFWGYYRDVRERIYAPGYYTVDTKYFWESNFYDLKSVEKEMLYSAQSQSFDPPSAESLGHEYGIMIVKDMVKNNIIGDQKVKKLKPM